MNTGANPIRHRSLLLVAALTIITLGYYRAVWFGRTWGELRRAKGRSGGYASVLHGIGAFIPVIYPYRVWRHVQAANDPQARIGTGARLAPWAAVGAASLSATFDVLAGGMPSLQAVAGAIAVKVCLDTVIIVRIQAQLNTVSGLVPVGISPASTTRRQQKLSPARFAAYLALALASAVVTRLLLS